jgi:hypothetical protein
MKSICIGASNAYTTGLTCYKPAIAINNNNQLVEVHGEHNNNLYYMLGSINGPTYNLSRNATSFGQGLNPSVSIMNGSTANYVVVSYNLNNTLYVKVGKADFADNVINWGKDYTYTNNGCDFSSIAINPNGLVMIAYVKNSDHIYYKCGKLDTDSGEIAFGNSVQHSNGEFPKVSVNTGNSFVEVHQSQSFSELYYNMGTLNYNNGSVVADVLQGDIKYLGFKSSNESRTPGVAINRDGLVVEVHQSNLDTSLYYLTGNIDGSTINLNQASKNYLNSDSQDATMQGNYPSVAMNDNGVVISVYQTTNNQLFGTVTRYADRSYWMKHYQDLPLNQLCMPGAHDAAMSTTQNCVFGSDSGNTITQIQPIAGQLQAGIRYFDLRPIFENNGNIYSGHYSPTKIGIEGCDGELMNDILNGVQSFLEGSNQSGEVVVLKFSHFLDRTNHDQPHFFNSSQETKTQIQLLINQLVGLITSCIMPSQLYVNTNATIRIADNTLATLTGGKGKVVILFDIQDLDGIDLTGSQKSAHFVNTYLDWQPTLPVADVVVYDVYSDVNSAAIMTSATDARGQLYKIAQPGNHTGDLYLCSWTLTLSGKQSSNPFQYTVLELSQYATGILASDIVANTYNKTDNPDAIITGATFPNIIYVDAADGFATDVCIWMNEQKLFAATTPDSKTETRMVTQPI